MAHSFALPPGGVTTQKLVVESATGGNGKTSHAGGHPTDQFGCLISRGPTQAAKIAAPVFRSPGAAVCGRDIWTLMLEHYDYS